MPKKCKHDGCETRSSFGIKGGSSKQILYCYDHKEIGMVYLARKRCRYDDCDRQPLYGKAGGSKNEWCSQHKTIDMVNLKVKRCQYAGCDTYPIFGIEGGSKRDAMFCYAHKKADMVDLKTKRCETINCNIKASFGIRGGSAKNVKYCATHREVGMVDLISKKCEYIDCTIRPYFGTQGGSTRFCSKHKEIGMVNLVTKKCEHTDCDKTPTYGLKSRSHAVVCVEHKEEGMINLVNKRCEYANCDTLSSYGKVGGLRQFCFAHKNVDMVNVISKRCEYGDCQNHSVFGIPGKTITHCSSHRQSGMMLQPRKKCIEVNCKELAIYGMVVHEHCSLHKFPDEVNIIERECNSCNLLGILDNNGNCETCDPATFRHIRLAKQNMVIDYLINNGIPITKNSCDKMIDGGECGKERPDIPIDCGTHFLNIEVDENQHSGRACECEQTRMVNISQSNGLKTIFLRFNPDNYKVAKKGLAMDSTNRRLQVLVEWIRHWMKTPPQDFLSVMYLYFNGYVYGEETTECILTYEDRDENNNETL